MSEACWIIKRSLLLDEWNGGGVRVCECEQWIRTKCGVRERVFLEIRCHGAWGEVWTWIEKKNIERRRIIFPRLCNAVDTFDDKRCDVNSGASIQAADSEKCQADASSVCNWELGTCKRDLFYEKYALFVTAISCGL